ncbi:DUF4199 domain-containing protein [Aureitalea marina]|uniref:DUF4199 domain-containing protein n=1 Tax=Aureitalea marina TaxID=930804 RepID=A0A2S7KTC8_9FLAO|nr:DUF4199 domain-containing protein [Aureitalea marina]PQB05856.1 hypothetical protein BST85_13830 [Aureitalea marina]
MLNIHIRYGFTIAFFLVAFFLTMKLFGLHQYPVFSIFNAVLFGGGIYRATQHHRRTNPKSKYQDLWQAGFMSGAVATLVFTAFMAFYMYQIDSVFAATILDSWNVNYNTGVLTILFSMVLMGLSTSVVCALTFMQRFKRSWNTSKRVDLQSSTLNS